MPILLLKGLLQSHLNILSMTFLKPFSSIIYLDEVFVCFQAHQAEGFRGGFSLANFTVHGLIFFCSASNVVGLRGVRGPGLKRLIQLKVLTSSAVPNTAGITVEKLSEASAKN